ARSYDSEEIRFIKTDAYESQFPNQSPYIYGGSNPILNVDVNGDWAWIANNWYNDNYNSFWLWPNDERKLMNYMKNNGLTAIKLTTKESIKFKKTLNSTFDKLNNPNDKSLYSPAIANHLENTVLNVIIVEN